MGSWFSIKKGFIDDILIVKKKNWWKIHCLWATLWQWSSLEGDEL